MRIAPPASSFDEVIERLLDYVRDNYAHFAEKIDLLNCGLRKIKMQVANCDDAGLALMYGMSWRIAYGDAVPPVVFA